MSASLNDVLDEPRILIQVNLKPVQGSRFQPTGFPSLGAAEFRGPDGTPTILVESAQSMANRLENVAWDEASGDLVPELRGLPYVATTVGDRPTDSIREAHRLNSPYLFPGIAAKLQERVGVAARKRKRTEGEEAESSGVDIQKLAKAVFFFDPNSVLHGVFLEKMLGTARLTRILSAFIEARDTSPAESGGVKNDRVDPTGGFGGASKGFGNVPFPRTEFTAKEITAFFSIDVALLRSYALGRDADELLVALALWKIQRFLEVGGRLRTACDLEPTKITVTRPTGWRIPSVSDLQSVIRNNIERCREDGLFTDPPKTVVEFSVK